MAHVVKMGHCVTVLVSKSVMVLVIVRTDCFQYSNLFETVFIRRKKCNEAMHELIAQC